MFTFNSANRFKKMGINGVAHKWFENYLQGRTQKVDINGNLSSEQDLDISVIQGSTLGPILFLCYINAFRPAIQSRIVTVPRILWEESAHQVRRDPFRPVFDPGTVWALVFLLYACVTLFFATGNNAITFIIRFFLKDCTCCVAHDAGVRVGRHLPLLVLRLVVGWRGRSRFVSILLVFDRPVDGRMLFLKKLLF